MPTPTAFSGHCETSLTAPVMSPTSGSCDIKYSIQPTWISADDSLAVTHPGWLVIVQSGEESQQHQHEEPGEEGVVDDVEYCDLHCKLQVVMLYPAVNVKL